MTRRGAVALLAVVAGIVSTAFGQVFRFEGRDATLASFRGTFSDKDKKTLEKCEKERAETVKNHPEQIHWGCFRQTEGAPYWCEINGDALGGIRIVSGKETIEITMAEVMEALRAPR